MNTGRSHGIVSRLLDPRRIVERHGARERAGSILWRCGKDASYHQLTHIGQILQCRIGCHHRDVAGQ